MNSFIRRMQQEFNSDFSMTGLRVAIIIVALVAIIVALVSKNKWTLAGTLAYIILP